MASSILQFFDLQKLSLLFFLLCLIGLTPGITNAQISPDSGNIIYVDQNVSGGNQTGDSWANAIPELRDALDWAQDWDGDSDGTLQIWVADGLYLPVAVEDDEDVTEDERGISFQLVNDVEIYGGFDGGESSLENRDWQSNLTILSGDIDGNDDPFEPDTDSDNDSGTPSQTDHIIGNNSYHVVTGSGTNITAILNGFTITAGNANGSDSNAEGGGMFIDTGEPSLINLIFSGNHASDFGGGVYSINNSEGHPTQSLLTNIIFFGNSSDAGGGICNDRKSSLLLFSVIFYGNSASIGGGIYNNEYSSLILTNGTFSANTATLDGGGMYNNILDNDFSINLIKNTIIWDNQAAGSSTSPSASIYNEPGSVPTFKYSVIANSGASGIHTWNDAIGTNGGNNLSFLGIYPLFSDDADPNGADNIWGTADDGLHLAVASIAIDAGDTDFLPTDIYDLDNDSDTSELIPFDIAGDKRIRNEKVDMGAYESTGFRPDSNNILYVDKNVSGGDQTGNSWNNATPELSEILIWAEDWNADTDGTLQVWVAKGIYYTYGGDAISSSFRLTSGVEVYGGFSGGESFLNKRNWKSNITILSGDIDRNDITTNGVVTDTNNISGINCLHVVIGSGTDSTAILDGFVITAGNNPDNVSSGGGGMFNISGSPTLTNLIFSGNLTQYGAGAAMANRSSNPTLSNVTFSSNTGGGMHNNSSSNPTLSNVTFSSNTGGGMYNSSSNPILSNVTFSGNTADAGGGMYNHDSSPTLINVTFSGNIAYDGYGGGMYNKYGSPTLINTTFFRNIASGKGGGIYNSADTLSLTNVIIWDNQADVSFASTSSSIYTDLGSVTTFKYSLIANSGGSESWDSAIGIDGGNNIDTNPLFYDDSDPDGADDTWGTSDDGLTLQATSPAINTGDNTPFEIGEVAEGITTDLAGYPRIDANIPDMGAYEFQGAITPASGNILYVDKTVSGGTQIGDSWLNAIPELRDALAWARNWHGDTDGTLQIWVAEGLYRPTDDDTDREATFQLRNNVEIYGGFAGEESSLEERDWKENFTTLSGDIDKNDNPFNPDIDSDSNSDTPSQTDHLKGNNSYHVVSGSTTDKTAILNGFTISAGNANGSTADQDGGGIYNDNGSPSLANITLSGNRAISNGGGMHNIHSSNPVFTNVTIFSNSAGTYGGGIANDDHSSPTLSNVVISGNTGEYGGGLYNFFESTPTLTNVTFSGNSADTEGGGMYNRYKSSPVLTNIIIWNNQAAGSNESPSASIYNNDVDSTPSISHSLIANSGGSDSWDSAIGIDGGDNIDTNPFFYDDSDPDGADNTWGTSDDGLALQATSPAINTGNNTPFEIGEAAEGITTDLAGNSRIFDDELDIVDMGAYEFQGNNTSGSSSVVIDGNAGWRMMGIPVTGVTIEDLAGINLVQGISGLPQADGDSNLYFWDSVSGTPDFVEYNGSYYLPIDKTVIIPSGTGFFWYMWGPEVNSDIPESKAFPLTVKLAGDEPTGDISLGTLEADWQLIANPFLTDINFNEITDGSTSLEIAGSVWDPNQGEEGSYVLTTSVEMDNKLSVWQGAYIELTSETEVVIPQSAKTTGASFLKQEEYMAGQVEFVLEGHDVKGIIKTLDRASILYFSERATPEWDGYDVKKLTPLSETWATVDLVGIKDGEAILSSQHSLPYNFTGSKEIPIQINHLNTAENFTLYWPVVNNLPSLDLWLVDTLTGQRYDLTQPGQIDFTIRSSEKKQITSKTKSFPKLPKIESSKFKTNTATRFIIQINPDKLPQELPTEVALNQNYPNPFNPTTVINYQLPVSSEVRLEVYDMLGRNVATLVSGQIAAGRHTVNFDASNLSSGIYLYRLQAGNQIITKKLTVIK